MENTFELIFLSIYKDENIEIIYNFKEDTIYCLDKNGITKKYQIGNEEDINNFIEEIYIIFKYDDTKTKLLLDVILECRILSSKMQKFYY